jgi:O-antigen/teichoic acid export membrane protein
MADEDVQQHFTDVAKGSAWNLFGNLAFKAVSFLYYILVARVASPDDLGLFFLSLGVVSLLDPLDDLGLGTAIAQYLPYFEARGEKNRIRGIMGTTYAVMTISSLILAVILFVEAGPVAAMYGKPALSDGIRLVSVLLVLNNVFKASNAFLQSRGDMKRMQLLQNVQNGLKLVFTLALFAALGASLATLILGLVAATVVAVLLSLFMVSKKMAALPKTTQDPLRIFPEVLFFGLAVGVVGILGATMFSTDVALLGYFSISSGDIAMYSLAYTLALALTSLPFSIGNIFFPMMSKLYGAKEMDKMREATEAAQRWSLFLIFPPAIVFLVFPQFLLSTVYGDAYIPAAMTMSIIVLGTVFSALSQPLSSALSSMRLVKMGAMVYLPAAVLFVALNILLIPRFGPVGPALSYTIVSLLMLAGNWYYTRRVLKLGGNVNVAKLFFAAISTLLVLLVVKPILLWPVDMIPDADPVIGRILGLAYLAIPAGLSFALFCALALLLRCFRNEDAQLIKRAMRRIGVPEGIGSFMTGLVLYGVPSKGKN